MGREIAGLPLARSGAARSSALNILANRGAEVKSKFVAMPHNLIAVAWADEQILPSRLVEFFHGGLT